MATKKGRPRGAFWVNQGGVPLIFATLLAFSSFVQVQAICPSTPENCGSQNQFCGALPSFGTGKYRAGCTWNNVTDIYCPTSCDNDPDNPDCNPNPPIEDCEYVWHIDSNEGYEASCSNKPTYSSYTGHGGLSNSCPYACTYETGDGFCTDAVTPPSVNLGFADGFGGDENVALIVQYGQGTPPDFKKVAFVHKRRFGVNYQFQATVMWKSQDNSGQLSFNRLRRVLPPAGANDMQSLGNYGYGVQFRNETCPWNSRIRNSHTYSLTWIDDHCTKYSVVAQDAVEESETDEAYLCPTETKPKLTISDELLKSENAHQVVDFNKRARSIQQPAIKLNWTDTSRNGVEDNRLVFLDKDLSGHFRLTATDAVPLQWSAFCAMDKGYSHTSHWGTLGSSCAAEDGFCASQYFLFAAKPEVNFIGFGEQEDFHINHATNTLTANLTGEKCEFSSLSVDNHRLQVMVRNLDPNPGHSLSWVNYDFSVYDSTVVFGGGGEKESAYASSKVYIPFNEWADTEVIQDQGNANDGMVLVSNRRPYLNWVANLEGMPIKHRGCMIEKRDNAGALISTYRDCSPRSEGSGKWRPNSYLQSGVNIFRMKVVDWRDHWVVVKKSFIVDTRDPSLVFLDSHPALTYETSRTVRFRADEPSCTFRWRQVHTFDAYGNSTSPAWTWSSFDSSDDTWSQTLGDGYGNGTTEGTIELEELGLGRHVFEIVPVDSAGNEGNMKRLIWEVSARISHDTDNDKLIRHFVIRSSRAEEHCDEFAHCTKELKFTTSFEGGAGFVNVEIINDLPDWLRGETAALDERTFEHTLYLSVDKITEPSQLSHKLKLGHVDKACPTQGSFSDYCRTGGPTTIDGYYVNTTNLVRPANVLEFDVRLHTYEPPTLELEPDDFIRKLSGGIELDITKQSNASVLFKNTGDFPLRWKMVYSEGGSGAVDECGLDEQKEYIGTKPSWITLKDEDTGSLISSDVHTIAAKSSQAVMIDFDTQQLRTAHYRVALMMQTNDYDLSEDKVLDSDQGMSVSLSDYKYNGCSEDFDCVSASGTSCVTGQAWGYIRDIGGNTCSQTFSNSGMRILRNIGDQVVNEEMGFRFLAMEVEGMGANTLIFLPKKLNKAYVAAGTEVRQAVNLVSMVGASDAYFIYDTDTFEPQYDGLLEMPFWIYLSMTKLDINRDTSLVTYEREPFLDVDGNVDLSLLDTLVANGSYPDVIGAGGTNSQAQLQQFSSRLESWLAQVGDAKSRFNTPSHLVERTEIINTGGGTGMVFGIPVELDVNFRFFEKYTDLGRETVECLLSGQQREKCVQLYSMTFTVENSNDHYFGTWPEPLGICQTLQGLQACTDDTLRKYQRAKLSQMEVEVEFEPGLCSASESVLVVNTSDSESSSFTQQAKAGEEVELVIHTRDFLGNDRWPPEFCRSSLECTASCTYEKTLDDKEFDFDPIQFGGFVVLGEWSGFAAESSKPIFKPSSALSDFERQNLKYVCSGNPYGMGGMGMPERLEFFTRTSLEFYQGDQGLGGFEGVGGLGGGLGGLDTSGELNYIVFDRIDPLKTRCWDARALLSWIEDPMSWHIEGMRHFPLDKYLLLTPEDITMITNVAGGRKLPIDGIFDEEEFMQTEQITQWSYSEDNGDGTHSIKIPALKAGTYQLFAGEYARDFVKSTPMSLGVPTVLGSSANISNFYRSDDVEYDPLVSFLKYSVQNIQSYFFEVVASEIDLQSFLVLDVNPMQAIAGDEFCFNVQAQDRFENVVMTENGNSSDLQFYMLFKAVSYKNSTIKAYRATYTQSNGDDDVLGVTYETCFLLERAGHYELWLSEAGAFASQSLENIQTILSRGGDGQAKRLNKHVPQETIIAPSEVSEATSCIDEFGTSKWECGNQTATKTMLVGDPIKFMLHSYDEYGNPLQSSQNYTFIARLWANVTENSSSTGEEGDSTSTTGEEGDSTSTTGEEGDSTSTTGEEGDSTSTTGEEGDATSTTGEEGDATSTTGEEGGGRRQLMQASSSPWTQEVASKLAYPSNAVACSDPYFGVDTPCPNEFVLILSSELGSPAWFGPKVNGTYKLTISVVKTLVDGSTEEKRIENIDYYVTMEASNLISPANSELYSNLPPPHTVAYGDGRPLPSLRFEEPYEGLFVMPKDRFGNFLSLPVESNILSSGVPLSPSDVLLTLYDKVRNGEVLSSVWSYRAQYDKERSQMANAVVLSLDFQPRMNGTYEFNVSISDGEEVKLIAGNPFELPVLEIICEEGSQAERLTGAYCVCSPGWYDQLTADLGDLPDCQRCGIELSGELDLTKYNTKPDQIECTYCPLCSDGQTYEYAPVGADSPYDCRCPDDFVRIPHLTSEEFPLNEFGRHLCHPCPEGAICTNGTSLEGIEAEDGYWRADPETDTFVSCDLTIAGAAICEGGSIEDGYCMDGHAGPLCTECDEGWGRAGKGTCIKCIQSSTRKIFDWLQIVGTIVGMTLLVTVFVYREIKSMHQKIKAGDFARSRARTQLLKSMLSYLQIVGIAKEVQVQWNPLLRKYFNTVNSMTSEFAFESQAFACQLPSSYMQKWQAYMLAPFFASAGLLLVFYFRSLFKPKKHKELTLLDKEDSKKGDDDDDSESSTFLTSFMTTMLVLGFLAYPSLVRKAVEVFGCRTMVQRKTDRRNSGNVIDSAISLLSVDNSVSCLSTEYTLMRLQAMVAIGLYGVGVPFSVFAAIKARRDKLHEKKTMLMFGFMYSGYKDQFWWWECMSLMRKLFMSLVLVFFSERLYIQLFLGLVVSQMFLLLQLRYKPFTTDLCNIFETMSLFALWFTLQGTFLYFEGVSIGVNLVITAALATINFGVILFFVLAYFYQTLEDKKEALRKPLAKVGINIDWVLETIRKFNKEIVDSTVSKNVVNVFAKKGVASIDDLASCPQFKQIETFKKILEAYRISEATEEELRLVQEIHAKLEEILASDEALVLTYQSPLMEGIQAYINRLRSESGAAYVNPLSTFDSLGEDRRTREQKKLYGQAGPLDDISSFLTRFRSETGRNFMNPLAEEGEGEGVGMGALGPLPEAQEPGEDDARRGTVTDETFLMNDISSFLTRFRSETGRNFMNPLAEEGEGEGVGIGSLGPLPEAQEPGEDGEVPPARKPTLLDQTFLMNDISSFLTRFRSETGTNFMNPLAEEVEANLGVDALGVDVEHSTARVSSDLAEPVGESSRENDASREELENLALRSTDQADRARADTFKLDAPNLRKTTEVDRKKSVDFLHSIDSELLRILNWRSEIAESGRYKPLQDAKVKHIHRHSVHHGRQRAQGKGLSLSNVSAALKEIEDVAPSRSAPNRLSSIQEDPGTPASQVSSEGGEDQALLSSRDRKESSSAVSVNPLAASLWKKAANGAMREMIANPLQAQDAGTDDAGSSAALPTSLTLDRSGSSKKFRMEASKDFDIEFDSPVAEPPARKTSEQGMDLNPMLEPQGETPGKSTFKLPTTLTLKKAAKSFKKKGKKGKK